MSSIAATLDLARRDLLDLGLRNPLLNYRPPKTRGVEVAPADATQIFESLISSRRSVPFFPALEEPGGSADTPRIKGRRPPSAVGLQTALGEDSLRRRLAATLLAANAHIEERGSNILYLAIGMLHWFEDDHSDRDMRAPLVLIPVKLTRSAERDKFSLTWTEEDIEGNLSLATKLKTEFRIRFPDLPEVEDLDVAAYAGAVDRAVNGMAKWRVAIDEVFLGFFSFGKFLMYRDLAAENWFSRKLPEGPPVLRALLQDGFRDVAAPVGEDDYLDEHIAPKALHQVVDVDSSQALALLDVRAGRNLVIQGPPGTGKSQTITNVIADALGQGKTVLFVAEKMAALEVVKRRLDKVGIGDSCLELHSYTANKRALLDELKRTLQLGKPTLGGRPVNLTQYQQLRDQLTSYCDAVNAEVGETGFTPYQVMGELLSIRRKLGGARLPRIPDGKGPRSAMSRDKVDQQATVVGGLGQHLARMGSPSTHPFRGSRLLALLPTERQELESALDEFLAAASALEDAVRALSDTMGIPVKLDAMEAIVLAKAGRRALSAPHLQDVRIRAEDWQKRRDEVGELLTAGASLAAVYAEFDQVLIAEAWSQDLLQAREVLRTTGTKWWRFLSGDYRRTRNRIVGLCSGSPVKDVNGQVRIVDAVLQARRLRKTFDQHEAIGAALFGVQWQGTKSDWQVLQRINTWVVDLYRAIGAHEVPPGIVDFLAGKPSLEPLRHKVEAVEAALPSFSALLPAIGAKLSLEESFQVDFRAKPLDEQRKVVAGWRGDIGRLPEWITYLNMVDVAQKKGLGWVVAAAADWDQAGAHLVDFFRHVALETVLRVAFAEREPLRTFSSASQDQAREHFAELDRACFKTTQLKLAMQHWEGLPRGGANGQVGVLLREFEKRARHLPIRKLMTEAGNAIQAIKPVFMMSPMSIATFLPAGAVKFDLVVFDEASQVKPVDAFGAVLRGEQLVVVGDSKQLPPTSFFDVLVSDSDLEDDEESAGTSDMESILGLVAGQGAPSRMLRWHYRSHHESLIALSNKEFYDSRLVIFPSPNGAKAGLGLVFHHLADTTYDRGRSRTNRKEALAVAQAVIRHAHEAPHLTLGVAAFSMAQADAILDELERLRAADPAAEAFFDKHPFEPFFVKNLESVQGDERDVIFISVGYGKDAAGYLAMGFGALNGNGGERRLNVLITRARLSCEVFSNLTHDDIDLARTQSRGVAALKAFLKFAATGLLDVPDAGRAEQDSVFEEQVADAIERCGHVVAAQVGSGGFRIDLAVVDPERPGSYLLGIECDGATYHSSRSARDRDRLREQVLVGLGWKIHRIWSTDWFANPDGELKRVLQAIDQARTVRASRSEATPPASPAPVEEARGDDGAAIRRHEGRDDEDLRQAQVGEPYELADVNLVLRGLQLHEVNHGRLVPLIAEIAEVEGPVHLSEVQRRIADACGVRRVGTRIEAAINAAAEAAARQGVVVLRGEFVFATQPRIRVRDRSGLPSSARRLELIAPAEIAQAVKQVVETSFGIAESEIPVAVARLFGFARTSEEMTATIAASVRSLVKKKELVVEAGYVKVSAM